MKTHYRKVFKSDHLGSADLEEMQEEGKDLYFTITHVKQEWGKMVAGKMGNFNIAYFKEDIKPLVINSINSKKLVSFTGSKYVEDWKNVRVELYVNDNVRFGKETVSGVRIKNTQPKAATKKVEKLPINGKRFEAALKAVEAGTHTADQIKKGYALTKEQIAQLDKIKTNG